MLPLGSATCPVKTDLPCSDYERTHPREPHPEIRAYKLGKKRWSYNQVELRLTEANGDRQADVKQTAHAANVDFPEPAQDSAVCFHVQLESGHKLLVHLYVVYDQPPPEAAPDAQQRQQQQQQQGRQPGGERFSWKLVTRRDCCKGCQGNVLRSLQRFGRLGKRSWGDNGKAPEPAASTAMKDPKYMYVSLDEACTHVDAAAFRLVAGVYNRQGTRLLATAVSPPVRVLANNDVPTGAARITLDARLPADWEGWAAEEAVGANGDAAPAVQPGAPDMRRKCTLRSSQGGSSQSDASRSGDHINGHGSLQPPPQEQKEQGPASLPLPQKAKVEARRPMSQPQDATQLQAFLSPLPAAPPETQILLQQLQQLQQLQWLQQLQQQQQQQQQAAALAALHATAAEQLPQLLQLLQAGCGGGTSTGLAAMLAQSLALPAAAAPLQQQPLGGLAGLLGGPPSLSDSATCSRPQLPAALAGLLGGAAAPSSPPVLPAWGAPVPAPPTLPAGLAAVVASLAGAGAQQGLAHPTSPSIGDVAAKQHSERMLEALQLFTAGQGQPTGQAVPPSATAAVPLRPQPVLGRCCPPQAAPCNHAPPVPRDAQSDAMALLADLAAAVGQP